MNITLTLSEAEALELKYTLRTSISRAEFSRDVAITEAYKSLCQGDIDKLNHLYEKLVEQGV